VCSMSPARRRVVLEGTQAALSLEGLPMCQLSAGRRTAAHHGRTGGSAQVDHAGATLTLSSMSLGIRSKHALALLLQPRYGCEV